MELDANHTANIRIAKSAERDEFILTLSGNWTRHAADIPQFERIRAQLNEEDARGSAGERRLTANVTVDAGAVEEWDSLFVAFLYALRLHASESGQTASVVSAPEEVTKLLDLSDRPRSCEPGTGHEGSGTGLHTRTGLGVISVTDAFYQAMAVLGESVRGIGRVVRKKSRWRLDDVVELLKNTGPQALPIITLLSILVGLILAFVGSVQLEQFGAQIYIADLVGLAMFREMGAVMTGIIMAGRTGAAFAAHIASMNVNEEVDALRTFGFEPVDFLILPRVLVLTIMMPILCVYADVLGVLGGWLVGAFLLNIPSSLYLDHTISAVGLNDFLLGIGKSVVFGIIIAFSGCVRGLQSARNAAAVGNAATSAVVTAIVLIVIADAVFAVVCDALGI